MNNIINYQWNGSSISFDLSGDCNTMINATEMAKAFPGKLIADWTRQKSTKEFLNSFSSVMGIPITELIRTVQGGNPKNQGTWMHEDVAIEFARWLNPIFAVWCNKKIKEILVNGYSIAGNSREDFERAYQDIQTRLSQVEQENYQLKQSLDTQRAAESFCNAVFQKSENLYSMTDITKGLNFLLGELKCIINLRNLDIRLSIKESGVLKILGVNRDLQKIF